MSAWLLLPRENFPPWLNMAWDEVLLENTAREGKPILRFYGWNDPAATFGYFQKYAEVEKFTPLRPLIRRPTGGGLVPHDADWTYCVAIPPQHPWYSLTAVESYQFLHERLKRAFAHCGTETELAPCCTVEGPGQCFMGAEKFDLLWKGIKIAGAAQRRNKFGLLIQGSVQRQPVGVSRDAWETAMLRTLSPANWITWLPGAQIHARVEQLAREKYASVEFNRKR